MSKYKGAEYYKNLNQKLESSKKPKNLLTVLELKILEFLKDKGLISTQEISTAIGSIDHETLRALRNLYSKQKVYYQTRKLKVGQEKRWSIL